jgi:hypothetical protein
MLQALAMTTLQDMGVKNYNASIWTKPGKNGKAEMGFTMTKISSIILPRNFKRG